MRSAIRTRPLLPLAGAFVLALVLLPLPALAEAEVIVPRGVQSMALDGDVLYWSSYQGCGGGEIPRICSIRQLHAHAIDLLLADVTFFNDSVTTPQNDLASRVAAEGSQVFWLDAGGDVMAKASGGTPQVLAVMENRLAQGEIAANGDFVYWTENVGSRGKLFRAPRTGGARQFVRENTGGAYRHLRADGTATGSVLLLTNVPALICCYGILQRVTPDGAGFRVQAAEWQGIESFAVTDGWVYFGTPLGAGSRPNIRKAPVADLTADVLVHAPDATGSPKFPVIAANRSQVFWQEVRDVVGPLMRAPLSGGAAVPMSGAIVTIRGLLANDEFLYARTGEIQRYPVDTRARTLDLIGNEQLPEVVQTLQDASHLIPLIDGKATHVRVYGRIRRSDEGLASIGLWPAAVLHGTRDGRPLEGSPLLPLEMKPLQALPAIDRTSLDTTLLFELPKSWTHGTVTLRSVINPSFAVAETSYTNNSASRTVSFQTTRGVCLDVVPVLTHAGVSTATATANGNVTRHFARAKSVFPTDSLYGLFRGGNPRTIPLVNDHYNLRDGNHHNMLTANLGAEFMFASTPSACSGEVLIRAALVPDASRFGMSHGTEGVIWALLDRSGSGANSTVGGLKGVAHEVGHQFGMGHVDCGGPASPHESWPYPSGCASAHDNRILGLDAISRELLVPFNADGTAAVSDFMSYSPLKLWMSEHTYRKLLGTLITGTLAPVAGAGVPASGSGAVLSGLIPAHGAAHLSFAYWAMGVTLENAAERIARTTVPSTEFELRTYDAAGNSVDVSPLQVSALVDAEGGDHPIAFHHLLEAPELGRVDVVRRATGAVVISRSAGVKYPEVGITFPVAGAAVGDLLSATWTARDEDGDPLAFLVRYSADGGASWQVLALDSAAERMELDTRQLAGGSKVYLEVTASDGLHSTTRVAGPFQVPLHAPVAQVLSAEYEPRTPSAPTFAAQSEPVVLRALAQDAEDGPLRGSALRWQVSGLTSRSGTGETLRLSGLAPGSYQVKLTAADSTGTVGEALTRLEIRPKRVIAISPAAAPALDGRCADAGYQSDQDPISLRAGSGVITGVRMVGAGGSVYVCFEGVAGAAVASSGVDLRLASIVGTGVRVFRAFADGTYRTGTVDPTSGAVRDDPLPAGLRASVRQIAGGHWNAELQIDAAVLGGWGRLMDGYVATDGTRWPAGANPSSPKTWGRISLGAKLPLEVSVTPQQSALEGKRFQLEGKLSNAAPKGATVQWSLKDAPCTLEQLNELITGVVCLDDGVFEATLTVSEGQNTASAVSTLQIANVAPDAFKAEGPGGPVPVGQPLTLKLPFEDAGEKDRVWCRVDWGDGTQTALFETPSPCLVTHAYSRAGLYTPVITLLDDDAGETRTAFGPVIVTDPAAGPVKGEGLLQSPAGAAAPDPKASGEAAFQLTFEQDPKSGAASGELHFAFQPAGLEFKSDAVAWRVVEGTAFFASGTGVLNGKGGYTFEVAGSDGKPDRLRIVIQPQGSGEAVYDNQFGAPLKTPVVGAVVSGGLEVY